jgi:hypothetical protein
MVPEHNRGVLYIVWGTSHEHLLDRSIASLKGHHPELPVTIHRVEASEDQAGQAAMLQHKTGMFNLTPYETTLFLDADTVVLGRLDHAFEKAERFGLACCICECPWARRYSGLSSEADLIEYNTGVLFFSRQTELLFTMWERYARTIASTVQFLSSDGVKAVMQYNDQASFAKAIDVVGFNPFVLPLNWNLRPKWQRSFFGPVRIWHDVSAPSKEIYEINALYEDRESLITYFTM